MARSRVAVAVICLLLVVGTTWWIAHGGLDAAPGYIEIDVPPTRFLDVVREGHGDWEPFVEPGTGYTGHRLIRDVRRNVTVRMHDINNGRPTSDQYEIAPGGYVVTGNQRLRIRSGPS